MNIDRLVVGQGAAYGLLLAAPAAIVNVVLAGQDPKPKAALNATLLALLIAFGISGFMAGKIATGRPAAHGALAGLVAFALVQVIGVLGRLDREAGISIPQIVVLGSVAAGIAAATSGLGAKRHLREEP
ncbi:MAG: hypothetical protein GX643_07485 [Acidimicrobiales bacterium]|mgnify:FL=1|nr:hypothetical protein [Acidimicrobiales bacterium]